MPETRPFRRAARVCRDARVDGRRSPDGRRDAQGGHLPHGRSSAARKQHHEDRGGRDRERADETLMTRDLLRFEGENEVRDWIAARGARRRMEELLTGRL